MQPIRPSLLAAAVALALPSVSLAAEPWEVIPAPVPMPAPALEGRASVNGIEMYYAQFGPADATPVLLIHGGLGHGDIWGAQVAALMEDYRVVVADTRGHGRSTNDGTTYSYDVLADDYIALIEALDLAPVHLIGWSDGANIGFEISKRAPEALASHFAHAGNVTLAGIDPSVETNAVFGDYVVKMGEAYAALSPTPDGYEGFFAGVAAMWGTDKPGGMEALADITVPTTIVQSRYDEAIRMVHSEEIAAAIPGASFVVLEDVSHFAMFQDPDGYTQAILAALP